MPEILCITAPCNPTNEGEGFTDFVKRVVSGVRSEDGAPMRAAVCPPEGCPEDNKLANIGRGMKWLAIAVAAIFALIVISSVRSK